MEELFTLKRTDTNQFFVGFNKLGIPKWVDVEGEAYILAERELDHVIGIISHAIEEFGYVPFDNLVRHV